MPPADWQKRRTRPVVIAYSGDAPMSAAVHVARGRAPANERPGGVALVKQPTDDGTAQRPF
jgi:hypothetical protein